MRRNNFVLDPSIHHWVYNNMALHGADGAFPSLLFRRCGWTIIEATLLLLLLSHDDKVTRGDATLSNGKMVLSGLFLPLSLSGHHQWCSKGDWLLAWESSPSPPFIVIFFRHWTIERVWWHHQKRKAGGGRWWIAQLVPSPWVSGGRHTTGGETVINCVIIHVRLPPSSLIRVPNDTRWGWWW